MSRTTQSAAQIEAPARTGIPNNLPHELSSFIGRGPELLELARLLNRTRLLTLTGPGGAGKTRLAQHVAHDVLGDYPDGVWLIELAPLADPALVASTVAQALGVREQRSQPLVESLASAFREAESLLLLDNCEHVLVEAAGLTQTLLRSCARLRVLATSREPLGVSGELTWPVPPLTLNESADALDSDAMQLFVERARAVRPDFELRDAAAVAQICRRLDGLPLAIELAAARVRALGVSEIAARLDDRFRLLVGGSRTAPARQQTLGGALDWSFDLLTADERLLFAKLAVFSGGFDLAAVSALCDAEVEDVLMRLVDRSLVIAVPDDAGGTTRFHLLETVRAYAWQRLAEMWEVESMRQRHADWILSQARLAEAKSHGPEQGVWLRWAEREHDNVRAALAWLIERGDADAALRLAGCVSWSWSVHMRWSESRVVFERVLALPRAERPTVERAVVLTALGTIATMLGDLDRGLASLSEAESVGRELGDEAVRMRARGPAVIAQQFRGEAGGTDDAGADLMRWAKEGGFVFEQIRGLETVAQAAAAQGQYGQAAALLEEGARLARESGDSWNLARCLQALGDVRRSLGDHAVAGALYEESQARFMGIGLQPDPGVIHNLGYVALAGGDRLAARQRFVEAVELFRRIGDRRGMAECVIGLGCVASSTGDGAVAARLFAAGQAALAAMNSQLWMSNRGDYERWLLAAQARLSVAAFSGAWTVGAGWSLDGAVAFALRSAAAVSAGSDDVLTAREREVARLVARGLTNRQVAEALVVTEKTAANHLQRVLDKLEIHSRAQLAARAAELGLT